MDLVVLIMRGGAAWIYGRTMLKENENFFSETTSTVVVLKESKDVVASDGRDSDAGCTDVP